MTENTEEQKNGKEKKVLTLGPKEDLEKANERVTEALRKKAQGFGLDIDDLLDAFARERDLIKKADMILEILSKFPDAKLETEANNK